MFPSSLYRSCLVAFLCLLSATAFAWNRGGHLVTGARVYDELEKTSPALHAEVIAILKSHPAYGKWEKDFEDAPTLEKGKVLMMLAAAFPDDARIGQYKRFDRPDWHYVNFPYTPGQPLVDVLTATPFAGKLLDALTANLAKYKDTTATSSERALALSWVLHLTGDITQPLHVTALVNADFPNGDRGGNSVYVRGSERAKNSVKLHKIWDDGGAGIGVKLGQAANIAKRMRQDVAVLPTLRGSSNELIRSEAANSYKLAVEHVYLNGKLLYVTDESADAPVVPVGYTKRLKELSEGQMQRVAPLLSRLLR